VTGEGSIASAEVNCAGLPEGTTAMTTATSVSYWCELLTYFGEHEALWPFHTGVADWYLVLSVVSEYPIPRGPQPYSLVGLNLDDGSLSHQPHGEFRALIYFAQPGHENETVNSDCRLRKNEDPIHLIGRELFAGGNKKDLSTVIDLLRCTS
jgi:hypothetical protein